MHAALHNNLLISLFPVPKSDLTWRGDCNYICSNRHGDSQCQSSEICNDIVQCATSKDAMRDLATRNRSLPGKCYIQGLQCSALKSFVVSSLLQTIVTCHVSRGVEQFDVDGFTERRYRCRRGPVCKSYFRPNLNVLN